MFPITSLVSYIQSNSRKASDLIVTFEPLTEVGDLNVTVFKDRPPNGPLNISRRHYMQCPEESGDETHLKRKRNSATIHLPCHRRIDAQFTLNRLGAQFWGLCI
ncbi:hypothetical protein CEXT_521511 [Caerostris extrusa]|uniref:Uncharacterized protein n=1 Tax=Caerostris extrusa TaxID=172846 RepID=A0AAV4SQ45_CAEEX|nr:hypothetical protein CEXT_521511 [Caerostris extrusa]